jgi:hypothetical protein
MDSKKVIATLYKIARNQQKIIEKLAQVQTGELAVPNQQPLVTPAAPTAPTSFEPNRPVFNNGQAVINALPAGVKPAVANVDVRGSDVLVQFKPGKATQATYDAVKAAVTALQERGVLPLPNYNVKIV